MSCVADGCDRGHVAVVHVRVPNDVTYAAGSQPPVIQGDEVVMEPVHVEVGDQRLGYCMVHAVELGLEHPATEAMLTKAGTKGSHPFPAGHALAERSWVVTS